MAAQQRLEKLPACTAHPRASARRSGTSSTAKKLFWALCKHNIQLQVIILSRYIAYFTPRSQRALRISTVIHLQKKVRGEKGNTLLRATPWAAAPVSGIAPEQVQDFKPSWISTLHQIYTGPSKDLIYFFLLFLSFIKRNLHPHAGSKARGTGLVLIPYPIAHKASGTQSSPHSSPLLAQPCLERRRWAGSPLPSSAPTPAVRRAGVKEQGSSGSPAWV